MRRAWQAGVLGAVLVLGACGTELSVTVPEAVPSATPTPEPLPVGDVVWFDDFDGTSLDDTKWRIEHSTFGVAGGSSHCYQPQNVEVRDGLLVLTATQGPVTCPNGEVLPYASGMVRTEGLASWTTGRFEVRMRAPGDAGMWSAAWLGSESRPYGPWPASGEIDIVELLGRAPTEAVGSLHWQAPGGSPTKTTATTAITPGEFHTYAVAWSPDRIEWSVDDVVYHRAETWDPPPGTTLPAPFDQPFALRLNLAVGGRWPGEPDPTTTWPAHLEIDWARVSSLV